MTFTGRYVLVGKQEKTNQKGERYALVALGQDADVVQLACKDVEVLKLPLYKEYSATLQYNSKYERLSLLKLV